MPDAVLLNPRTKLFFSALLKGSFSVRDLAKEVSLSPASASLFVKDFSSAGLLNVSKKKNYFEVSINRGNVLAQQLIRIILVQKLVNSKGFANIKKISTRIGLYGSAADGTFDEKSDIDLWVLSKSPVSVLSSAQIKHEWSKELGVEINIKFFIPESWESLMVKDPVFFNELKNKSCILWGV